MSKVVLPFFLLSVPTTHPALVSFRTVWPPRQPKRSASAIPPERHRIRDPDPLGLGGHRTSGPLSRPHLSVGSALRLWFALFDSPDFPLSFCLFIFINVWRGNEKWRAAVSPVPSGAARCGQWKSPSLFPESSSPRPGLRSEGVGGHLLHPSAGATSAGEGAEPRAPPEGDPETREAVSLPRRPRPRRVGAFASLTTKSAHHLRIPAPAWVETVAA